MMATISGQNFKFKCYRCGTEKSGYSELGTSRKGMAKILGFKNNAHGSVCVESCVEKEK